jgi:hypothetical protein
MGKRGIPKPPSQLLSNNTLSTTCLQKLRQYRNVERFCTYLGIIDKIIESFHLTVGFITAMAEILQPMAKGNRPRGNEGIRI